jgi:hypothetical protein
MNGLNVNRMAQLLGVAGSTAHDGEAVNAIRLTDRELRRANVSWGDLLAPYRELAIATQAAAVLLAENVELRAEVERLSATTRCGSVAAWQDITTATTQAAALWALDLHAGGAIWLNDFDEAFLRTLSRWRGRLTPKQQPIFREIIARIIDRYGVEPPGWGA